MSRDSGLTWTSIAAGEANDGTYTWTVTGPSSNACLINVTCYDSKSQKGWDTSNATFKVQPATVLDHVIVTPSSLLIYVGQTQQFYAKGYDAQNNEIQGLSFTWTAEQPAIGTINQNGLFTAGGVGAQGWVNATTTSGGVTKTGTATVTVTTTQPVLDHVIVIPASASLSVTQTCSFSAQGYDSSNNPLGGVTYSWSVSGGVGTVSPTNTQVTTFTATTAGTGTITATGTYGGNSKTGTASITVTGVQLGYVTISPTDASLQWNDTQQFNAQAYDTQGGQISSGVTYQWTVSGGIGSVSPTSGQTTTFTATNNGTGKVTVTATFNSVSKDAEANVTVGAGANDFAPKIVHTPVTSATAGTDISIEATVTDTDGTPVAAGGVTLKYRKTGDQAWCSVSMSNGSGGTHYTAKIPASVVTSAGVQYKIVAVDTASKENSTDTYAVSVTGKSETFGFGQPMIWVILLVIVIIVVLLAALLMAKRKKKKEPAAIAGATPIVKPGEKLPEALPEAKKETEPKKPEDAKQPEAKTEETKPEAKPESGEGKTVETESGKGPIQREAPKEISREEPPAGDSGGPGAGGKTEGLESDKEF